MHEAIELSRASPLKRPKPPLGYPWGSPKYRHYDMATPVIAYLAPLHFDRGRNAYGPQAISASAVPTTTSITAILPTVLGHPKNTPYSSGFQIEGYATWNLLGEAPPSYLRGIVA